MDLVAPEGSRMRRVVVSIFACALVLLLPGSLLRAELADEVKAVLQNKLLGRAEVGIQIVRLGASPGDARILFRHNSDIPLIPASNLKLITTSAAMDALGPDFQFRTLLLRRGDDLVLIGDGDPTFGDAELLKKAGWNVTTVFKNWAAQLRTLNIATVHDVLVDDSIFDEEFLHPRWAKHQFNRFGAQLGGVNLNANCVDFYIRTTAPGQLVDFVTNPPTRYITVRNGCLTGRRNSIELVRQSGSNDVTLRGEAEANTEAPVSVTIHDPPLFAATVLAETLAAEGIKVTGKIARDRTIRARYSGASSLTTNPSPLTPILVSIHQTTFSVVMARANKDSMNLYAESLCKRLGAQASGVSGSWENGTAAVGGFLKKIGVPETQFSLDDGSGLSRDNTISANAMVSVLVHNYHGKSFDAFLSSLSVAGSDGTLKNRFEGTDFRGRVFGKSGFISAVSSLSGYLKGRDGQWYAFSILMNGIPELSNSAIKPLQERIVRGIETGPGAGR